MSPAVRLGVWSGPRSISTALMRSFENRLDTKVVDEPLYAYYLAVTGIDHPGRELVLERGETDWRRVVAELTAPVEGLFYQKHMAHHLVGEIEWGWISSLTNVILIRDPSEVIDSYLRSREAVISADIGLDKQCRLYEMLQPKPPVIDASDFLRRPERYLRFLCAHAGVEFTPSMLHWPPGPRPSDGVWAPYWYSAVVSSTGFRPYEPRAPKLRGAAARVAAEVRPCYERLYEKRVRL